MRSKQCPLLLKTPRGFDVPFCPTDAYRNYSIRFLLLLLFVLSTIIGQSQIQPGRLSFEYLTVKDGLAQNTVHSIVKDQHGFMWFGTWNGLCRYDGYKFTTYRNIPGDSSSISNNRIHVIYKDPENTLWVASFDSIICRYNYETDNFTRFYRSTLPPEVVDSTNRTLAHFFHTASLENIQWDVISNELWQTNLNTGQSFRYRARVFDPNTLNDDFVYCVYKDDNDILWIGTSKGGVNKADLKAKPFHYQYLVVNENGNQVNAQAKAIWADQEQIWIGSNNNGVVAFDRKTGHLLPSIVNIKLSEKRIRSIYKDKQGFVWAGCRMGLYRIDPLTGSVAPYHNRKLPEFPCYSIIEDQKGNLLVGGSNAIYRYNRHNDSFTEINLLSGHNIPSAMCMMADRDNNLWIGTEVSGIYMLKYNGQDYDLDKSVHYHHDLPAGKNLPDKRVYSICIDQSNNIWAGTANGLSCISPQTGEVKNFSTADGLADSYVAKAMADQNNHLWISHKKGISRLHTRTHEIKNYSVKNWSQGYEFLDGAGYTDPSTGEMFFGGIDGYISFLPTEIIDNPYLPKVVFTDLQVLNHAVEVNQPVNGRVILEKPLYMTKRVKLSHLDRGFSIGFSALHYSEPVNNKYAYKLSGFDNEWMYTDASMRKATYTNLPAGKYTFMVKASNSDGLWNTEPAMLEVTMLPPWWKTSWAYVGYLVLFFLSMFGLTYFFVSRQKMIHQIQLEKVRSDKIEELNRLKSDFFTRVSHEFRTPLTLILGPLEKVMSEPENKKQSATYLQIIDRNTRRMLRLINELLEFKKIESGHHQVRISYHEIVPYLQAIVNSFEFEAQQRKIDLTFSCKVNNPVLGFDADKVDKILINLLSNSFKYSPDEKDIQLFVEEKESKNLGIPEGQTMILIKVIDQGQGIPPGELAQVFDFFYRIDEAHPEKGSGIGLALVKELTELLDGKIWVESAEGQGSTFYVEMPFMIGRSLNAAGANNLNDFQKKENIIEAEETSIAPNEDDHSMPLILLIEDNSDVRHFLRMELSPAYRILEAKQGNEGLQLALEHVPDLVVSDIMMPGINGIELCRMLKNDERTSHIPVILLTARHDDEIRSEGYQSGADAYLTKPFNAAILQLRVGNLIESRQRLRELFGKSQGTDRKAVSLNPLDEQFLEKATLIIRENLTNNAFDVEFIAEKLGMTRTQLYRKIKSLTNQTVQELIVSVRMGLAAELLLSGQYQVAEVAYKVGYTESGNFIRVFGKFYGKTPKGFMGHGNDN